jgi:hypothetical protein
MYESLPLTSWHLSEIIPSFCWHKRHVRCRMTLLGELDISTSVIRSCHFPGFHSTVKKSAGKLATISDFLTRTFRLHSAGGCDVILSMFFTVRCFNFETSFFTLNHYRVRFSISQWSERNVWELICKVLVFYHLWYMMVYDLTWHFFIYLVDSHL